MNWNSAFTLAELIIANILPGYDFCFLKTFLKKKQKTFILLIIEKLLSQ